MGRGMNFGSVIFNYITKDVLNILYVFCSNLGCLSSFWSLCFIGMTSKDTSLRESSYILTFSIQFTHSELHSGGFTGYLESCTANGSEMPKMRWWELFPVCLVLTRRIRETWQQPEVLQCQKEKANDLLGLLQIMYHCFTHLELILKI